MATPIAPTPLLEGESAEQLEKYMKRPMTKKEKEISGTIMKKIFTYVSS